MADKKKVGRPKKTKKVEKPVTVVKNGDVVQHLGRDKNDPRVRRGLKEAKAPLASLND